MNKIIKVNFEERQDVAYVDKGLVAWNYGEILQVEGLALPDGNIEVHFSLTDREGDANVYIGTVEDNVITVDIPNFIFQKENVFQPTYDAYAFIYQTDEESGRTIKKITFTIQVRPKPTTDVPEDQQDQFLQEARQIMAETKEVAQSVRTDADNGVFNGKDGTDGKDGKDGVKGDKGDDGKSAYQYAQEGGFEGTEEEFTELIAQAGQVDLSGYITKEDHEAELLKTVIKTTTSPSPFHHITDSANMKVLDFGMEGKTEQDTTKGYQLFDINGDINKTYKGTDSSVVSNTVENNILTTSGENSMQKAYGQCFTNLKGKTITISAKCVSLGTNTRGALMTLIEDGMFSQNIIFESVNTVLLKNYTVTSDNLVIMFANVDGTGAQFTDIKVYEGSYTTSTIPEWERYTNGPSPNPDYKQEVKNAGVYNEETGRYEIGCEIFGEDNLFNKNTVVSGMIDQFGVVVENVSYYSSDFIPVSQGKSYYCTPTGSVRTKYYDSNKAPITVNTASDVDLKNGGTFTIPNGVSFIRISIIVENLDTVMISPGTVESPYIPHASQPFTLTSDRPLTKWDKLVKRDGVWGWSIWSAIDNNFSFIQQTGDETIDGRIRHRYQTSVKTIYRVNIKNNYCTHLSDAVLNSKNDIELKLYGEGYIYITFYDETGIDTLDKAKQWLADMRASGENITFVYETNTEQAFHPLPDEEQTLLNNLETYYGVTNVYNEQGCPMWLTYVNDSKLYVDKKLLEIQQAII